MPKFNSGSTLCIVVNSKIQREQRRVKFDRSIPKTTTRNKRKVLHYSYSFTTYIVGTHYKRLDEALLMSTHNIWFYGEIRRYLLEPPSHMKLCLKFNFTIPPVDTPEYRGASNDNHSIRFGGEIRKKI